MKQGFCKGLEEAVKQWHKEQGQTVLKLKKFINSPEGWPLLIVHGENTAGKSVDFIDFFNLDCKQGKWVIETIYWDTEEENIKEWVHTYVNPSEEFQRQVLYDEISGRSRMFREMFSR